MSLKCENVSQRYPDPCKAQNGRALQVYWVEAAFFARGLQNAGGQSSPKTRQQTELYFNFCLKYDSRTPGHLDQLWFPLYDPDSNRYNPWSSHSLALFTFEGDATVF